MEYISANFSTSLLRSSSNQFSSLLGKINPLQNSTGDFSLCGPCAHMVEGLVQGNVAFSMALWRCWGAAGPLVSDFLRKNHLQFCAVLCPLCWDLHTSESWSTQSVPSPVPDTPGRKWGDYLAFPSSEGLCNFCQDSALTEVFFKGIFFYMQSRPMVFVIWFDPHVTYLLSWDQTHIKKEWTSEI